MYIIHSFSHSFINLLLDTYRVENIVPGTMDLVVKDRIPCHAEAVVGKYADTYGTVEGVCLSESEGTME